MITQKLADWTPSFLTHKYTGAEPHRMAHEICGAVVTFTAFVLKPRRAIRLREEHVVDRVNLVILNIMVSHKSTEFVDVVPSLKLSVRNPEKLAREFTGMPMTCSATVVPQPVQVSGRRFGRVR